MKTAYYAPVVALAGAALAVWPAAASNSPERKSAEPTMIVTEQSRTFVTARVGVPVEIQLRAQAGTGFSWVATRGEAELKKMKPLRGSRATPGGSQIERFQFLARRPGNYRLAFSYDQPWSGGTKGARAKNFIIVAR